MLVRDAQISSVTITNIMIKMVNVPVIYAVITNTCFLMVLVPTVYGVSILYTQVNSRAKAVQTKYAQIMKIMIWMESVSQTYAKMIKLRSLEVPVRVAQRENLQ